MSLDNYPSLEDFIEGRRLMYEKQHQIKNSIKKLRSDDISENVIEDKLLEKELKRSRNIHDESNKSFELDLKMFNNSLNETFGSLNDLIIDGVASDKFMNFHKEKRHDKYNKYSLKINKGCSFENPYLLFRTQISNLDPNTMSYFLYIAISMSCGRNIYSSQAFSTNLFIAKMCGKHMSEYIHEGNFCTKMPLMIFHNILYEDAFKHNDIELNIFGLDNEAYKIEIPKLGFEKYYDHKHTNNSKLRQMSSNIFPIGPISKSIFVDSNEYQFSFSNAEMRMSNRTKFLIIRFVTKLNKDNHELLVLQPNIIEVHMIKNGITIRRFSNIMSLKIMDISLFVVPLLSDATNWRDLKTMIKSGDFDSTGLLSIEESVYDFGIVELKLVTDIPCEKYGVIITPIKFNISYCHSFAGLADIVYAIL